MMNKCSIGLCPLTEEEGLISEKGKGAEHWWEDQTLAKRRSPGSSHSCAEAGGVVRREMEWEARLGALGFMTLSLPDGVRCQDVKLTSGMRIHSGG